MYLTILALVVGVNGCTGTSSSSKAAQGNPSATAPQKADSQNNPPAPGGQQTVNEGIGKAALGIGIACSQPAASLTGGRPGLWIAGGEVAGAGSTAAKLAFGFFDADKIHGGCNGVRVGYNFIAVAAHCITAPETFLLGYVDPTALACQKSAFAPASLVSFILNPQYDASTAGADIGLIVVQPIAPGTDPLPSMPVQPVLSFTDSTGVAVVGPNTQLLEAGWGYTPTSTATSPTILNSVLNTVQSLDSTRAELTYVAGTGKGGCNLDSGSPAVKLDASGNVLGLISIANRGVVDAQGKELDCAVGSGVDVDVRYYRKWLACAGAKAMSAFNLPSGIKNESEDDDKSDSACAATVVVSLDAAKANASNCPAGTAISALDWTHCVPKP